MNLFSIAVLFAGGLIGILIGLYVGLSIQNHFYQKKQMNKKKADDREAKKLYPDCNRSIRKKSSLNYLIKMSERSKNKKEKKQKKEEIYLPDPDCADEEAISPGRFESEDTSPKENGVEMAVPSEESDTIDKEPSSVKETQTDGDETENCVDDDHDDPKDEISEFADTGIREDEETEREDTDKDLSSETDRTDLMDGVHEKKKGFLFHIKNIVKNNQKNSSSVLSRLDNEAEGYISEKCSDYGEDVNEYLSKSMGSQDNSYNIIRRKTKNN